MSEKNASVLWLSTADRMILGVVAPVTGANVGFFLPRIAEWATTLEWVPLQGPLELVASWSDWWVQYVCMAVGALLGVAFVAFAFFDTLRVVVTDVGVRVTRQGETLELNRADVEVVFVDRKEIVLLDRASHQLLRAKTEEKPAAVQAAFTAHGYPFRSDDPYEQLYRRWVQDTPALPGEANAVMRAREKALEKKSESDARDLRRELDRIGVVVRDRDTAQYWRPLVGR